MLKDWKTKCTKAGHENPEKPAGGKNKGTWLRQWCHPSGLGYSN